MLIDYDNTEIHATAVDKELMFDKYFKDLIFYDSSFKHKKKYRILRIFSENLLLEFYSKNTEFS